MATDARIAVLAPGQEKLELRDITIATLGPHEVVVRQRAFGVCHSQLDRIYDPSRTASMLLGHESIGTVVEVGAEVTYVGPGDEVLTTWVPRTPLLGRAPVPSRLTFPAVGGSGGDVASTHNTFTWGTHAVVDEQWLVKTPEGTSLDLGAIIGCALMTGAGAVLNTADVRPGQAVAVWGTGGVGLSVIQGARLAYADRIVAVDIDDEKLALARQFGATDLVNARSSDAVDAVRELTPHEDATRGADYVFDCTGIGTNIPVSLAAVRPGVRGAGIRGGAAVLVGIPRATFELSAFDLLNGEKSLLGCVGGSCDPVRDFPTFIDWATSGHFDPSALVTDRYPLDQLNTAVDDLHHGRVRGRAVVEVEP